MASTDEVTCPLSGTGTCGLEGCYKGIKRDMVEVRKTLYGNGSDGLKSQVTKLLVYQKIQTWAGAAIASGVIFLVLKAVAEHMKG